MFSKRSERLSIIVEKLREKEEEKRVVAMAGFSNQGAQLRWEVPQRRVRHNDLIKTSDAQLSFLIKAVYDLLPTPANKNRWYKRDVKCTLCGGRCYTTPHFVSLQSCPITRTLQVAA